MGYDSRLSNFEVEADGTYYIVVWERGLGLGTYTLSVTETDLGAIARRGAEEVTVGGDATGDIERSGERDWYEVELVAGTNYQIDIEGRATGEGTLLDPYLWGIFTAEGTKLPGTEKNDGGEGYNTRLAFSVADDGAYYIATAGRADQTGTYRVSVSLIGDSGGDLDVTLVSADEYSSNTETDGAVDIPGSVTGRINYEGDVDWVAVVLEGGTEYRIDLKGQSSRSGTLWDPHIKGIYDGDGDRIVDGDFFPLYDKYDDFLVALTNNNKGTGADARLTFTPDADGTYYIAATHADTALNHTGTYTLEVEEVM